MLVHSTPVEAVLQALDEHPFIGASMFCLTSVERHKLLKKLQQAIEGSLQSTKDED